MNTDTNLPDPGPAIIARLADEYPHIPQAIADYETAIGALPDQVQSKADHDAYVDLISKIKATGKSVEASRVAEKDPFLRSERAVDGFFQPLNTTLSGLITALSRKVKVYLDDIEEQKRREARRLAEEERRKAAELRAAEEERRRRAEEAAREATKAKHNAVADVLGEEADRQSAIAAAAEKKAEVKPAELARTRSDQGTLSTLRSHWTFEVEDWDGIDLNVLRPYLKRDAVEAAIRSAVKIGLRDLSGVRIFQDTGLSVR